MSQKKPDPPRIFHPCSQCYDQATCRLQRGCYRWQAWFRAYWRALRTIHYERKNCP